jgi:hypothetical protein
MQLVSMRNASDRVCAQRKIYQSKKNIDRTVKKKYHYPVVFPRSGDHPVVHIKIYPVSGDPFDIVAAIQIDGALTAFLRLAVEADIQSVPVSILLYPIS